MSTIDTTPAQAEPSGEPDSPRELDTALLGEITDRDGLAAFDPTSPGGIRELTADEHQQLVALWPTDHEAYLDTRPSGGPYDPSLDYGHPAWREPESDDEADARRAHLEAERAANPPSAPELRAPTEVEDALDLAGQDASLADRAHDPDPELWARYEQLRALDELRPLPESEPRDDEIDDAQFDDEIDEEEL